MLRKDELSVVDLLNVFEKDELSVVETDLLNMFEKDW